MFNFLLLDCSVCSQDYFRTEGFRCSKCPSKPSSRTAALTVLGVLAGLLLMLFVYYMIRIEKRRVAWNQSNNGFKKILAVQSLKIIIVSWQIINQVVFLGYESSIPATYWSPPVILSHVE